MVLTSGTRRGPYEIQVPLGAGGMGEVYRAHDSKLGRDVEVKVLPETLASDREALARFEREARAVAALSHPNILAIHDIARQDGQTFVVMELLEGETLRERLSAERRTRWPACPRTPGPRDCSPPRRETWPRASLGALGRPGSPAR